MHYIPLTCELEAGIGRLPATSTTLIDLKKSWEKFFHSLTVRNALFRSTDWFSFSPLVMIISLSNFSLTVFNASCQKTELRMFGKAIKPAPSCGTDKNAATDNEWHQESVLIVISRFFLGIFKKNGQFEFQILANPSNNFKILPLNFNFLQYKITAIRK